MNVFGCCQTRKHNSIMPLKQIRSLFLPPPLNPINKMATLSPPCQFKKRGLDLQEVNLPLIRPRGFIFLWLLFPPTPPPILLICTPSQQMYECFLGMQREREKEKSLFFPVGKSQVSACRPAYLFQARYFKQQAEVWDSPDATRRASISTITAL